MKCLAVFLSCIVLFLLFGCAKKTSQDELRKRIFEKMKCLVEEFSLIQSSEVFDAYEEKVSLLFEDIADCMVEMHEYMFASTEANGVRDNGVSELLKEQMRRIIALPGGEAWLVRCQVSGARILDCYRASIEKKARCGKVRR